MLNEKRFDVIGIIKSRQLKLLGHTLTADNYNWGNSRGER